MGWSNDPEYKAAYNARRRARRADPEYMARSRARWKAQKERREAEKKKEQGGDEKG